MAATAAGADDASWTLSNVDSKSTFELRHWLVRNTDLGSEQAEFEKNFEAKYGKLLHPNFLHAAVCTIRERDEKAHAAAEAEVKRKEESGEIETLQQRLARQKAERKAAAIARSQERQKNASYFAKAKEDNVRGKQEIEDQERAKAEAETSAASVADEAAQGGEADESSSAAADDDDPFALGKRLKVHSN